MLAGVPVVTNCGYHISDKVRPSTRLDQGISSFKMPGLGDGSKRSRELIASFLAATAIFKRHVPEYDKHAALPRKFVAGDAVWDEKCLKGCQAIKDLCSRSLVPFVRDQTAFVKIDFGEISHNSEKLHSIAARLQQKHDDEMSDVCCISRMLSPAEEKMIHKTFAAASMEGECVAALWALERLHPYLTSASDIVVMTDAKNLEYMRTSMSPLLVRMRARIASLYDEDQVRVVHRPREQNVETDALARGASERDAASEIVFSILPYSDLNMMRLEEGKPVFRDKDFSVSQAKKLNGAKPYRLINKSWWRVVPGGGIKQMVVPPPDRTAFQVWAHGDHLTKKEILERISGYYYPAIKQEAELRWRSCEKCQAAIVRSRKYVVSGKAIVAKFYGQYLLTDWKGPLQCQLSEEKVYHMNFMDLFSKTTESFEFPAETLENAKRGFELWAQKGVMPEYCLYDNDSTFGDNFTLFLQQSGVKGIPSGQRLSPEHVSSLERYHKEFDRFRRTDKAWRQNMPKFLARWNSGKDVAGATRAESIFGLSREASKTLVRSTLLSERKRIAESRIVPDKDKIIAGDRVLVSLPPSDKGEPVGAAADVQTVSESGSSLTVQLHRDGQIRKENVRNVHKIGSMPLEKDVSNMGMNTEGVDSIVLYSYANRLWLGEVKGLIKNGVRIRALRATVATRYKSPHKRIFSVEGDEWVIRPDDILAYGQLDKHKMMMPVLLRPWTEWMAKRAADRRSRRRDSPERGKQVSFDDNVEVKTF